MYVGQNSRFGTISAIVMVNPLAKSQGVIFTLYHSENSDYLGKCGVICDLMLYNVRSCDILWLLETISQKVEQKGGSELGKINWKKIGITCIGTFVLALGIFLILSETKGADPMSVFLQGMHLKTGLQVGTINQMLNGSILLLVFLLDRSSIGIASLLYVFNIGFFMNLLFHYVPYASPGGIGAYAVTLTGVVLIGIGSATFLYADYGAGAVEGLMVYLNDRYGLPLKGVRMAMDASFVFVGYLLGGLVGVGTILGVLLIGPTIEVTLKALKKRAECRGNGGETQSQWAEQQA